jgi:hypothetical protein
MASTKYHNYYTAEAATAILSSGESTYILRRLTMGGVALCAYIRLGWEASAWLGLARPCWAASPFRYFFISEKKVIQSTIEKEAREKEKDKPNRKILQTIDSRWSTI